MKRALHSEFSESYFLGPSPASQAAYGEAITQAQAVLLDDFGPLTACYSGEAASVTAGRFAQLEFLPALGDDLARVLEWVGRNVLRHSIVVTHPHTMAHLHCPPLIPALAAELLVSATNQSMDSWDQAPAATFLEQHLIQSLAQLFELGDSADGIFTSGGTQSNFMALLLARDTYASKRLGWSIQEQGLPPEAPRFRILCSDVAHFSVMKSAAILGLGYAAVVPVATDAARQMCPLALAATLTRLRAENMLPIALVATAGTTDFGSIDPLSALADLAAIEKIWLHVDAAYGGALMLSSRHRALLSGIERADSVTVDFHKLFFQPISCSALLVRDKSAWEVIRYHADYLNPEENESDGVIDLVTKSIQTTRRFDGLKLFVTLQTLGRQGFTALLGGMLDLAQAAGALIGADSDLELANDPMLVSVVFRYCGPGQDLGPRALDTINAAARKALLLRGDALIGITKVDQRVFVKFTLMNPLTTLDDVRNVLRLFKEAVAACQQEQLASSYC